MSKYTVVVADASRARFFALKDSRTPEVESSPQLVEKECLINPETAAALVKRRGNSTGGRTYSSSGGSYAFDDHRGKHERDELRRFAGLITREAFRQVREEDSHSLVLVAGCKTLGLIRGSLATHKSNRLGIREYPRDLTGDSPRKIQELLARQNLIPAMNRPSRPVVRV